MKIYIITSGEYDEYRIEKVFLDKEKANLFNSCMKDSRIEEYDSSDNEEFEVYSSVTVEYKPNAKEENKFTFDFSNNFRENWNIDIFNQYTQYDDKTFSLKMGQVKVLKFQRFIKRQNLSNEQIKDQYKQVAYDLMSLINTMKETEG